MLYYEEIYNFLYMSSYSEAEKARARCEITHMSDQDWNDWVSYRNQRRRQEAHQSKACV